MLVRKVVCQKGLPINISSQVLDLQVVDWVADKDPRVGCQEELASQVTRMEVVAWVINLASARTVAVVWQGSPCVKAVVGSQALVALRRLVYRACKMIPQILWEYTEVEV